MSKKRATYVPPFLDISLAADGKLLFNLRVQDAVMPTASHLEAKVTIDDSADHDRVAATFLEAAATLYRTRSRERELLQALAAWFSTRNTPMGEALPEPDFPF